MAETVAGWGRGLIRIVCRGQCGNAFFPRSLQPSSPGKQWEREGLTQGFGIWAKGFYPQFPSSHSRTAQRWGGTRESPYHPQLPWLKEATSSGVCPYGKAKGNPTLAEARSPRPVLSSWAAVPPPPPSASRSKGQRSGRPCELPTGAVDPRLSRAAVGLPPMVPAHGPRPLSGAHCSLPPGTTSLCRPARWLPGTRTEENGPSQEAARCAWPDDCTGAPASSTGRQGSANSPSASQPAGARRCLHKPNSWAPNSPGPGSAPQPSVTTAPGSHAGAAALGSAPSRPT